MSSLIPITKSFFKKQSGANKSHWKAIRLPFLTAVSASFMLLQLLFLGNLSYLYGTQFRSSERVHSVRVLMVDYDGGLVGQSLHGAYEALKSPGFFTVYQHSPAEYPTVGDMRKAIFEGHYWAAVYSKVNASSRLSNALVDADAAIDYESADAASYIWNEARYSAESQSVIQMGMQELLSATRSVYYKMNGTAVSQFANMSNPAVLNVFTNPIEATAYNIQPSPQGTRVLYNTVTMILPIIQQFFFMMALNGISAQFEILLQLGPFWNAFLRAVVSILYTLVGALCTTGYIWAFRESWPVNGNQFVLTWMVFWIYMHIHFLIFDILTAFLPMAAMPFAVLTWAIMNVASTLTPFEMNPGFYRWGYALPAHEAYQLLVEIWSHGYSRQVYRALPILFAWWIVGLVVVPFATQYRCTNARKALALEDTQKTAEKPSLPETKDAIPEPELAQRGQESFAPRHRSRSLPVTAMSVKSRSPSQTYELMRLEQHAYGPSYHTPFVRGIQRDDPRFVED